MLIKASAGNFEIQPQKTTPKRFFWSKPAWVVGMLYIAKKGITPKAIRQWLIRLFVAAVPGEISKNGGGKDRSIRPPAKGFYCFPGVTHAIVIQIDPMNHPVGSAGFWRWS
ncbi:MAG: hypothetical protein WCI11_08135 [Candidatus Methylumidiphilus sp.]